MFERLQSLPLPGCLAGILETRHAYLGGLQAGTHK